MFPTQERPLQPYEAVVRAVAQTRPAVARAGPDVVVHDILTLAPALAAELEAVPARDPHPARLSGAARRDCRRTRSGPGRRGRGWARRCGVPLTGPCGPVCERGRDELNDTRRQVGLGPVTRLHGGLSPQLCLVGTLPQLEYPRDWPGPRPRRRPADVGAAVRAGRSRRRAIEPLVLVAPSHRPGPEPIGCCGPRSPGWPTSRSGCWRPGTAGRCPDPCAVPRQHATGGVALLRADDARLRRWSSATPVTARWCAPWPRGGRVLAVPHVGDMAENAARVDWCGRGVRLPWPLLSAARRCAWPVRRALRDDRLGVRARAAAALGGGSSAGRRGRPISSRIWRRREQAR